jgi:hypothetical protein
MVGNWLFGVARRTALKAKVMIHKRRAKEREASTLPASQAAEEVWQQVQTLLDEELNRLPDKYRVPVVLCELEGQTIKEAARHLGWPQGTLATRLAQGRRLLAKRLSAHGVALSAGALAALLAQAAASASMPASLISSTTKVASLFAAGKTASGLISAPVVTLTQGVLKAMLLTKLKSATVVLFLMVVLGAGISATVGTFQAPAVGQGPPREQRQDQGQAKPDDRRERVVELKQQLHQMKKKIARLEQETQQRRNKRNPRDTFLADRFNYRIRFETGYTESKEGGRIEIREVWRTRSRIEVGGQYLVRGKYVLPPGERGKLYFYETATGTGARRRRPSTCNPQRWTSRKASLRSFTEWLGPATFI